MRSLPEAVFTRTARHSQRGEITLLDMLRTFTNHIDTHAAQIERIREKCRESRART